MENTQKDHIFTEIYLGIHAVMVLMVLVYYVYTQTMVGMMTFMLIVYGIYIGFELYLFATRQIFKLENIVSGYFQSIIDILFISISSIYLNDFYYIVLPIYCLFILVASLANHRTISVVHGILSSLGYLTVGILNGSFSVGVVLFQGGAANGLQFFCGRIESVDQ